MPPPNSVKNIIGLPFAILGIPIKNLDLQNSVIECLEKIEKNRQEKRVSFLSLIDSSLITHAYGWSPSSIDNSELLSVARDSDHPSLTGTFLRGLTKLLGTTPSAPYSSYELLLALCQALGEREKGIFILGGVEKETKNSGVFLHDQFSKLRLVGIATPLVFTEGQDLINSRERDALLVEQINASNADVLLISLGTPKQEIWLKRVSHLLFVPLIVTIDDSLKGIEQRFKALQPVERAKSNLKHFDKAKNAHQAQKAPTFTDSIKLMWIALPLVIYHTVSRCAYQILYAKKKTTVFNSQLFLSAHHSIAIIALPESLDSSNRQLLMQRFEDGASQDILIFDFRKVRHIQPEGFYLLIKTWLLRNQSNKLVYGFCPTTDIKWLMKLHRTGDLFKNSLCDKAETLISRLKSKTGTTFYDTFTQSENLVTISLLGALDNEVDYAHYMKKWIPIISQKNCCIDFSYCTFIDNTGFAFLLNLQKHLNSQQHALVLSAVNHKLRQQFKMSLVDTIFTFKPSGSIIRALGF